MKIFKNILITFLSAFVTIVLVYGGYNIYASADDSNGFDEDFTALSYEYHNDMNDFFNEKIEYLVEILEEEDFFENEDFIVPEGVDSKNYVEKCGETNVSTYCVAIEALDIYIGYLEDLNVVKGSLSTVEIDLPTVSDMVEEISVRDEGIESEVSDAKTVMFAAVAAYDEFKTAYPMHKKYKEIIENLVKYKIAVKKIANQTVEFPLRFIDATSSTCE
jgi:hypothetical protein